MVPERSECLWVASTQFDRSNMAYINQSRNWYFDSELLIFSSNHLGPTFPQCFATSIVLATTSPRRSSLGVASRQGRGLVWREFAWTTPLATYVEQVGCFQGHGKKWTCIQPCKIARFPGSLYISPRRKSDLDENRQGWPWSAEVKKGSPNPPRKSLPPSLKWWNSFWMMIAPAVKKWWFVDQPIKNGWPWTSRVTIGNENGTPWSQKLHHLECCADGFWPACEQGKWGKCWNTRVKKPSFAYIFWARKRNSKDVCESWQDTQNGSSWVCQ